MTRLFALAILFLLPLSAASAQFVYGDTQLTLPGQCGVFLDAIPKVTIATTLVGTIHTCKYDVSTVANGSHSIKFTAIGANDPVWGSQESVQSAPFAFVRPASPIAPSNLRLGP